MDGSDQCGNKSNTSQIITISDTKSPKIKMIPPPDITTQCDEWEAHACPVAEDACDALANIIYSFQYKAMPDGCVNEYIVARTWVAGDRCGNTSSITQNVYVKVLRT